MSTRSTAKNTNPTPYDDGIAAAQLVHAAAKTAGSKVAACGGLALHVYGLTRAAPSIDLIGETKLKFKELRSLNNGGVAYGIAVNSRVIEVNLILRTDAVKELYDLALEHSRYHATLGVYVITPEHLVLLTYLAGRGKEQADLMWLLRANGPVDRKKLKAIVTKQMGKHSYWALHDLDQLFLEADQPKARDVRSG